MTQAKHDFAGGNLVFQSNRALANLHILHPVQLPPIDPLAAPPDIRLIDLIGPAYCFEHRVLPWRRVGGATVVLCTDVDLPAPLRRTLTEAFGPIRIGLCGPQTLDAALMSVRGPTLARLAETRVPLHHSCRNWNVTRARRFGWAVLLTLGALILLAPAALMLGLLGWACLVLVLNTSLKLAAALAVLFRSEREQTVANAPILARFPVVSVLVPLYKETQVARTIIRRMDALEYPRDKLDVCLVVEDDDALTRTALEDLDLPDWAQVIEVPAGTIRTKPRALNFAMSRARGSIIGIYDAEDAPEARQICKVVQRFAERPSEVACLQGQLDYYNPKSNWIARCFTLEYATWFRLILPGMQRLGLVIPLGGTTLFLRRDAIEKVGGWDAHNVTEDADLGVRLARAGYRTEVIETVTMEEANARLWPWVKQRSRWLKGYAVTYAVHMRAPRQLLAELGLWRFFGVQLLFLGTLSAFVMAPLLWSFWLVLLGLPHPMTGLISGDTLRMMALIFVGSEVISLAIAAYAVRRAGRPWLALWGPCLQVYFPLATLAVYKGLAELWNRPFYWDKTEHGVHQAPHDTDVSQPPQLSAHQVAAE